VYKRQGRSYGIELDAAYAASTSVTLDASLGLLQTEITEADPRTPQIEGNSFGQDPSLTATVGAVWRPVDWAGLDARVRYVGRSANDFNNVSGADVGDFFLVDVGATATLGAAEVRAFVRNALDETGVTRRLGSDFADVTDPFTVGLSLTARF
jgi:outer membrane receptor protein involved in Fe transport